METKMYESGENYLETILRIKEEKGSVRSIDIARTLNFSKPSVSRAVSLLKKDAYIEVETTGEITLTKKGREKAEAIYERHQLLTEFLMKTAEVTKEIAEQDACKIEHIISEEVMNGIKKYLKE